MLAQRIYRKQFEFQIQLVNLSPLQIFMFKKPNTTQNNYCEDFGLNSTNFHERRSAKTSRTRLLNLQRGSLLRRSLQKSINSQKLAPLSQKKFNDYGFDSKQNFQFNKNGLYLRRGLKSWNKEEVSSKGKEKSETKVIKKRNDFMEKKRTQRAQESHRLTHQRKSQPLMLHNDARHVVSARLSPKTAYKPKAKQGKYQVISSSTQCGQQERSRSLGEQVKLLSKAMSEYYELYTNSQQQLVEQKKKTEEQRKKCEIIKQLYQQKFSILLRNDRINKKKLGHLFSYKEFPKDFIPEEIIAELLRESSISESNTSEDAYSQFSSLSLISH